MAVRLQQVSGHVEDVNGLVLFENRKYRLTYEGLTEVDCYLLDGKLTRSFTGDWEFHVEDYAGETTLTLMSIADPEKIIWTETYRVLPMDEKLSPEAYYHMIEEMPDMVHCLLTGLGHTFHRWEEASTANVPLIAHLIALKMYQPLLQHVFSQMRFNIKKSLVTDYSAIPFHQVKHISAHTMRWMAQKKSNHLHLTTQHVAAPTKVYSLIRNETHDLPENRYVKYLLTSLYELAEKLLERLKPVARPENFLSNRRIEYWQKTVMDFLHRMRQLELNSGFYELGSEPLDRMARLSISNDPYYNRFFQITNAVLHPGFRLSLEEGKMEVPTQMTYRIYEYWVLFRFVKLLAEMYPQLKWKSPFYQITTDKLISQLRQSNFRKYEITGMDDKNDFEIRLTFEEEFPSYRPNRDRDFISISKEFRTDLFLRVRRGSRTKAVIFDAKYRTAKTRIYEALRELHIYRDAIRTPKNESIDAAFVVTPGYQRVPETEVFFTDEYRSQYSYGGFVLKPKVGVGDEDQVDKLEKWLRACIDFKET